MVVTFTIPHGLIRTGYGNSVSLTILLPGTHSTVQRMSKISPPCGTSTKDAAAPFTSNEAAEMESMPPAKECRSIPPDGGIVTDEGSVFHQQGRGGPTNGYRPAKQARSVFLKEAALHKCLSAFDVECSPGAPRTVGRVPDERHVLKAVPVPRVVPSAVHDSKTEDVIHDGDIKKGKQ